MSGGPLVFPPLPPLPPLPPHPSSSRARQRASAPPAPDIPVAATRTVGPSLSRRPSRVSFRDVVDVADIDLDHPPSPHLSRYSIASAPAGTESVHLHSYTSKPKPVLKRTSSSLTTTPSTTTSTRNGRRSSHDFVELDWGEFSARTLRYARASPASSRLSDGSFVGIDAWSNHHAKMSPATTTSPLTTGSAGSAGSSIMGKALGSRDRDSLTSNLSYTDSISSPALPSPHAYHLSAQSLSVASSSSTSSSSSSSQGGTAPATPGTATGCAPVRKGPRQARSPIPSWSSACPSLVPSSHRASLASTLTAPSMTSLLLSPSQDDATGSFDDLPPIPSPRPHDHHDMFIPPADMPELPPLPEISVLLPKKKGGGGFTPLVAPPGADPNGSNVSTRTRLRSRRSEPTTQPSPANYTPPPSAAHRLLKLQRSLADLRAQRATASSAPSRQRRASSSSVQHPTPPAPETMSLPSPSSQSRHHPVSPSESPASSGSSIPSAASPITSSVATPTALSVPLNTDDEPATAEPPPSEPMKEATPEAVEEANLSRRAVESPPSPTVADLARSTPRSQSKASSRGSRYLPHDDDDSEVESDLDLSLPLLNAALRSHVIPSSSRLLVSRQHNEEGRDDTTGLGWSGSDSEEEEFSRTVARIALRKQVIERSPKAGVSPAEAGIVSPRSPGSPRSPLAKLGRRPSLPASRLQRRTSYSPALRSSSPSLGPPTPASIERPSTACGQRFGTAALLTALVESKYASAKALPRPKAFVEGWGAPEVLVDDKWPPDGEDLAQDLDSEAEADLVDSRRRNSRGNMRDMGRISEWSDDGAIEPPKPMPKLDGPAKYGTLPRMAASRGVPSRIVTPSRITPPSKVGSPSKSPATPALSLPAEPTEPTLPAPAPTRISPPSPSKIGSPARTLKKPSRLPAPSARVAA